MYHLHAKILRRADGRSATAAAAYRAAAKITDQRTGLTWDFTRKRFVHPLPVFLPQDAPPELADRAVLWNEVEIHATRQDAQVAREIEVAIPHGLAPEAENGLVQRFAQWLVNTFGIAVDATIHRPKGNHHAHLLTTTSRIGPDGIGRKVRELDVIATRKGNSTAASPLDSIREQWQDIANEALDGTGRRIDRRSLVAQGINRAPQTHQGPAATAMARRNGSSTRTRTPHPPGKEIAHETEPRTRRTRRGSDAEPTHGHQRTRRR